jgi:lysophospholipase L1-like esterase
MKNYSVYIAIGDSMSIDLYPALDRGFPPKTPIGAAALLYRNDDLFWPEFKGKDLLSQNPELRFVNMSEDGASTWELLDDAFYEVFKSLVKQEILVSITIGGNDALQMLASDNPSPARLTSEVAAIMDRYEQILSRLRSALPRATMILNTIYDPSDGAGSIPGYPDFSDKLPFLDFINDKIRGFASDCFIVADIHQRFLGHGIKAPQDRRYYWSKNLIEPSALGASEIRALWFEVLNANGMAS